MFSTNDSSLENRVVCFHEMTLSKRTDVLYPSNLMTSKPRSSASMLGLRLPSFIVPSFHPSPKHLPHIPRNPIYPRWCQPKPTDTHQWTGKRRFACICIRRLWTPFTYTIRLTRPTTSLYFPILPEYPDFTYHANTYLKMRRKPCFTNLNSCRRL